jgi:hypothetical protein
MIWRLPIMTTMRTTTIHYKMVEPAATAKGTVAMAAVAATKTRMRTNAPCHSHLRRFFHRRGCLFIIGPCRSATILRAEDGVMKRVVGDDCNDDLGSNDAAIVVVQHVLMHPPHKGGGGSHRQQASSSND